MAYRWATEVDNDVGFALAESLMTRTSLTEAGVKMAASAPTSITLGIQLIGGHSRVEQEKVRRYERQTVKAKNSVCGSSNTAERGRGGWKWLKPWSTGKGRKGMTHSRSKSQRPHISAPVLIPISNSPSNAVLDMHAKVDSLRRPDTKSWEALGSHRMYLVLANNESHSVRQQPRTPTAASRLKIGTSAGDFDAFVEAAGRAAACYKPGRAEKAIARVVPRAAPPLRRVKRVVAMEFARTTSGRRGIVTAVPDGMAVFPPSNLVSIQGDCNSLLPHIGQRSDVP